MTTLGALILALAALLVSGWILDLVRRGRLYVGYAIVVLALIGLVVGVAIVPWPRDIAVALLGALYPREPIAVVGLAAVLLLLIYLLHQISVLSEQVATLTQELAIRRSQTGTPNGEDVPVGGGVRPITPGDRDGVSGEIRNDAERRR